MSYFRSLLKIGVVQSLVKENSGGKVEQLDTLGEPAGLVRAAQGLFSPRDEAKLLSPVPPPRRPC